MSAAPPLPDDFRFGVATAGFQIEGGFNGPGEPRNNWFRWEAEGRVEPSGDALDFWNRYEDVLDRAAETGVDMFRFSVEWARCEPSEGHIDSAALDRYAAIIDACKVRGIEPMISLHHFTHPWWLGEDFWLDSDAPARLATWVGVVIDRLGDRCKNWVTINELNILAIETWLTGSFVPGRMGSLRDVGRAIDHLATAHVLSYDEVKRRRPEATVSTNNFTFGIYELDRMITDVLTARLHEIGREDLDTWLAGRRSAHDAATVPVVGREWAYRALARKALPLAAALPRTVDAVYASEWDCTLDTAQIDYYNPSVSGHFAWPGRRTSGKRAWLPTTELWEDPPDPSLFAEFVPLCGVPDRPLWIVENGLCNRVHNGRSFPRLDGWDRPRYLRAHLRELVALLDAGIDIGGYLHWTLADNYEWGSYQPRFGLFGIDRARGNRWMRTDAMGHDAAGTYRQIIEGLRSGDRTVLDDPLR